MGVNGNKGWLTVDLSVPAGQRILQQLVAGADVLIDNFKIGTLAKWGFDDAWFSAQAPRLVRCSITGYGTTGPKAALPRYAFILLPHTPLLSLSPQPPTAPHH